MGTFDLRGLPSRRCVSNLQSEITLCIPLVLLVTLLDQTLFNNHHIYGPPLIIDSASSLDLGS